MKTSLLLVAYFAKFCSVCGQQYNVFAFPRAKSSDDPWAPNWISLTSKSSKFEARNSHASCVFDGKIWVIGGRTVLYQMYNWLPSYKKADIWYSEDGANYIQEEKIQGDFFAQNADVQQPGPIAPFYARFGHTLDSVSIGAINGDSNLALDRYGRPVKDMMILAGGFSPDPSNDVWVTTDGRTWLYAGLAPWSPRAWHRTAHYNGTLTML